jgi:5-methyltetrahydrofolate--homocysteine methyltransferase
MERQGFTTPLLIGGATTSRVHTAVKIHPNYRRGQAVYVNDASRAVGVTSALISGEQRDGYIATVRSEYARIAGTHARGEENKRRVKLAAARANALKLDWSGSYVPARPQALGVTVLRDVDLAALVPFVDWSPFFSTWELTGKYPAILDDDKYGSAARALFADAQAMLAKIVGENWFDARAVAGFWPANAEGDDILVYAGSPYDGARSN